MNFHSIKNIFKVIHRKLVITIISFLFFICANAQVATATLDRNKILLGEQVTLQLKAEEIDARLSFLQNWFEIPDTIAHFEVVKRDPIDTVDVGGYTTYIQKITVTSFDSGKWKLPPQRLILQDRATGKQTLLQTDSVVLEVLPVDVSNLQNYHDIKDILDVEVKPDYTLYIAIAASAIVLAVLVWLFIKAMKKKKEAPPKPAYKGTPLEHALQQLKELQKENLPAKQQLKLFYTKLTDILRNYFADKLKVRSSQATSDELMVLLSVYLQNEKSKTHFYQLLRLADAVKFAKYFPAASQNDEAVQTAVASLQHIDALTEPKKEYAE